MTEDEEEEPELVVVDTNDDAADPKAVAKRTRKIKLKKDELANYYRSMFKSHVGRRLLWEILAAMHPFDTEFGASPAGFPDQQATWTFYGKQMAGLALYRSWQMIDPEGVLLMQRENDPLFAETPKNPR